MKKVMFALAVAGMFAFASCGSNTTETTTDGDSNQTKTEETVAEPAQDETQTPATDAQAEGTEGVAQDAETPEPAK